MEIEQFLNLAKRTGNSLKFKPAPVPDAAIEKILDAGRWAMSDANGQPCEFIVVRSAETRARISAIITEQQVWEHTIEQSRVEDLRHPGAARAVAGPPEFQQAPAMVIVCADQRTYQATVLATHFYPSEGTIFHMNIGNAVQCMHLAAASLGLGALSVHIGMLAEAALKKLLGVPEAFRIFVAMPLGYPMEKPSSQDRRDLKEISHQERYDMSKFRSEEDVVDFIRGLRKNNVE